MALSQADKDFIAAAIVAGVAAGIAQLIATPAVSAPVAAPKASSKFVDEVIRGEHPCTADGGCGRVLKTLGRAGVHGSKGHFAAK